MKRQTLKIASFLAVAGAILLSSCSPARRTAENSTSPSKTNTPVMQVPANTQKNTNKSSQKVEKNKTLPKDRKELQEYSGPKVFSPEEFSKGIVKGNWAIETVYGKKAVGETVPYINFSEADGRIYGNNGCNTINAGYKYDTKNNTLEFINPLTTMKLCGMSGLTDREITDAINETRKYSLEEAGDGYVMKLYNSKGQQVMQLVHQNLDFLNGTWKVTSIDGKDIDVEKMKLVFDVDERKVHGNTGCNVLNGRLETDLDEPNTFSFEGMGVTMMMCPEIEYQTAMLVALEEACKAKPISKNEVILLDSSGNEVMTLSRTSDK